MDIKLDYDLFVIGGGSGGLRAAKTAAMLGAKVALADFVKPSPQGNKWGLGGTCVNVGCIPKKLFHFSALCKEFVKDAAKSGWDVNEGSHNWNTLKDNVLSHIKKLNWSSKKGLLECGIKYFNFLAKIINKNEIELTDAKGNKKTVTSSNILISVGGRPNFPENIINIKELSITSDDIFFLNECPKKTLVIGSGYIGLECGGFLSSLGSEVDICVRSQLLRGFDRDCVDTIEQFMEDKHNFLFGVLPERLDKLEDGKIKVVLKNLETNETFEKIYDTVICATGRNPDLSNLGLESLNNVKFNGKKLIVNENYEISDDKNIFAIGDIVNNSLELTPIALKEGEIIAEHLFYKERKFIPINYDIVATTIFTPLEFSSCGYSEEKAIEMYGEDNIIVFDGSFTPLEWTFNNRFEGNICYSKIITKIPNEAAKLEIKKLNIKEDQNHYLNRLKNYDNIVLGIHYVGPNAGEIMQGYAVAMLKGVTFGEFTETIGIHPTTSENIVNLKYIKSEEEVNDDC